MAKYTYQYDLINGPPIFDLAHALFRGSGVIFTAKQTDGDKRTECWKVNIMSVSIGNDERRQSEIFRIAGIIWASGPNARQLDDKIAYSEFSGQYDARRRKGAVEVDVHADD